MIDKLNQMSTLEKLRLSDTRQDEAWAAAHPEAVRRFEEEGRLGMEAMLANPAMALGFKNQVEAVLKHDTYDRLPQIKAPTLVISGLYDGSCPAEITRAFAGRIPGARLEMIEHGHGSWYFDPQAWEMIIDFLH